MSQALEPAAVPVVTFLTRAQCGLCATALEVVECVLAQVPAQLTVVDIDSPEPDVSQLRAKYDWDIPVVLIDGRQHSFHRVDERRLRAALDARQRTLIDEGRN